MEFEEWEKNKEKFKDEAWLEEQGKALAAKHDLAFIEQKLKKAIGKYKSFESIFDWKKREYALHMSMLWGAAKLVKTDEAGAR